MNVLYVCRYCSGRSPTAATLTKRLAKEKGLDVKARARGITPIHDCYQLTNEDIEWADRIGAMDKSIMEEILEGNYSGLGKKTIDNLDVGNEYEGMEPRLISILEPKINKILDECNNH